uniref:Uncharacterized protein n=1 Tax=Panagrolaimus superbus TaxID=310955 RepID=A0A914YQP1_9BILA
MFITSILHRIFGKKSKGVEIAKNEKKKIKSSEMCEIFQSSLEMPSTSKYNAYELDLKLLKMRHQRNCKNINPQCQAGASSILKSIKKSQHVCFFL